MPQSEISEQLNYECQNCIGMIEHGCYCKAMGAKEPGGSLPLNEADGDLLICPSCQEPIEGDDGTEQGGIVYHFICLGDIDE